MLITIILVLLALVLFGMLFKSADGSVMEGVGNGCGCIIAVIAIIIFLAMMANH